MMMSGQPFPTDNADEETVARRADLTKRILTAIEDLPLEVPEGCDGRLDIASALLTLSFIFAEQALGPAGVADHMVRLAVIWDRKKREAAGPAPGEQRH